jgi:RNA polymerase sigma-70 factor (ECF subfamily)
VSHGPSASPGSFPEGADLAIEWVEPIGDANIGLEQDPAHSAEQRERISLAFIAALQRLSARQRAALLLHDVLDFSQNEVAEVLDSSPSAVNSLLFRARETMSASPTPVPADPKDPEVRELLDRYMRAWERADISEFLATVSDDVRISMPPIPTWYQGSETVAKFIETAIFEQVRPYGITMRPGSANGQPAFATYEPGSDGVMTVSGIQVIEVDDGSRTITGITSFRDPEIAVRCGFPRTIS